MSRPWAFAARRCLPSPRSRDCVLKPARQEEPQERHRNRRRQDDPCGRGRPAARNSITVRDLFFNTPARKKFLKAESTELSHIASLVTHYALAHPEKHFELHSATNALLVAPPVAGHRERVYQVFGPETLEQLIPLAAVQPLERVGLPQPPPWRRDPEEDAEKQVPGEVRLHGFVSKPEIQKLNRNSIFIFVNGRLIRDRLIQHGTHRRLPQYSAADGFSCGFAVPRNADCGGRCQCSSFQDRGPLPAAECNS